jgi:phenylalanine-4-hydroxylase
LTGFELAPVMGALPGRLFYPPLADGILRSTPDLRPVAEQSFSPDPDVIHELVGHAVMLADPDFADMYRWFGRAAKNATSDEVLTAIAKLFWFTMEVGVVIEEGHPRACGAAILSSVAELESFANVELRDFRIDDVIVSDIDDSVCQPVLFVAESVSRMKDEVKRFLDSSAGA